MGIITDSVFIDCLIVLIPIVYLVYKFFTKNNDYWDKRGVDNSKKAILFSAIIRKASIIESCMELYEEFSTKRFGGFLQASKPMLMICDLDLVQKILVKDFTYFQDRSQPDFRKDFISQNLVALRGQKWRATRYKLSPTFSSGKLKNMFEQVAQSGNNMLKKIVPITQENVDVESKTFFFQFTLDVIASCAFGVQFDTKSVEVGQFKSIIQYMLGFTPAKLFKFAIVLFSPRLGEILKIKSLPSELEEYVVNLVKSTLKFRKENNVQRNDYFQLLLTLKEQEESGKDLDLPSDTTEDDAVINQMQYTEQTKQPSLPDMKLFTDESIAAHSLVFLTAGAESTTTTLTFVLFELTQHMDMQQRVQQEVDASLVKHGGLTYEGLKDMTFLDQVIQETQRTYPLLPIMIRECVQSYQVPDSDLVIEKGVTVCIPIIGLHKDPRYYPDPERFDPERFAGNNFKPSPTFLPFGDGPRICIAMRFAVMELKICIAKIMSEYSVKLSEKTPLPLKLSRRSFVPEVDGGIWLRFENRKKSTEGGTDQKD